MEDKWEEIAKARNQGGFRCLCLMLVPVLLLWSYHAAECPVLDLIPELGMRSWPVCSRNLLEPQKVGSSKYAFYTLSNRLLLTYLTFFYWEQWLLWGFMGAKVQKNAHNSHNYPKKFGSLEKCAYFCSRKM